MTTCPHCTASAQRPHALFDGFCQGCRARYVGRSVQFDNAKKARPDDDDFDEVRETYRKLLQRMDVQHQRVIEARRADFDAQQAR